jgi:hypothetical protein
LRRNFGKKEVKTTRLKINVGQHDMNTNNDDETDLCAVASASFSTLKVTAEGNFSIGSKRPFTSTRRAIAINKKIIIRLHQKSFNV